MIQTLGSELPTGTGFVSYAIRKLGAAGLRVTIKRAIAGVVTLAVETAQRMGRGVQQRSPVDIVLKDRLAPASARGAVAVYYSQG